MQSFLDIFGSPLVLILICIGIIGLYFLLTKTNAGKRIGWLCVLLLILIVWTSIVPIYIMPNTGLAYGSVDYNILQGLLINLPMMYFVIKAIKG